MSSESIGELLLARDQSERYPFTTSLHGVHAFSAGYNLGYVTTTAAAKAAVAGIAAARTGKAGVKSLQAYHADLAS